MENLLVEAKVITSNARKLVELKNVVLMRMIALMNYQRTSVTYQMLVMVGAGLARHNITQGDAGKLVIFVEKQSFQWNKTRMLELLTLVYW